jgi:predicted nucleic acid-binding protein
MIVVDASVLATALVDEAVDGRRARRRLRGERLAAPFLIDLEVVSAIRQVARTHALDERRVRQALAQLVALPLRRARHTPLLPRIWALRDNLTPYDAAYVALAEAIGAPLLTADRRLAGAPGVECDIELIR